MDLALAFDEFSRQRVDDVASVGGVVARGGEACVFHWAGDIAKGHYGAVAHIDEGVRDAALLEQGAKPVERISFEETGEVDHDIIIVATVVAVAVDMKTFNSMRRMVFALDRHIKKALCLLVIMQTEGQNIV